MSYEPRLHRMARSVATLLPDVTCSQPFGPDYDVFKVGGKIFMMTTDVRGTAIVTLKCEPDYAVALRDEVPTVTLGYHMNKRHWISLRPGPSMTAELVTELVENSYLLVVEKLRGTLGDSSEAPRSR